MARNMENWEIKIEVWKNDKKRKVSLMVGSREIHIDNFKTTNLSFELGNYILDQINKDKKPNYYTIQQRINDLEVVNSIFKENLFEIEIDGVLYFTKFANFKY